MRLVGVSELLGGIALIVPWATGIAPVLTLHLKRDDAAHVLPSVIAGALAALIAVGRFGG